MLLSASDRDHLLEKVLADLDLGGIGHLDQLDVVLLHLLFRLELLSRVRVVEREDILATVDVEPLALEDERVSVSSVLLSAQVEERAAEGDEGVEEGDGALVLGQSACGLGEREELLEERLGDVDLVVRHLVVLAVGEASTSERSLQDKARENDRQQVDAFRVSRVASDLQEE